MMAAMWKSRRLAGACGAIVGLVVLGLANAASAQNQRDPVWGLYASMQLPSTTWSTVDPCDIVYTVAWVAGSRTTSNVAAGTMRPIPPFVGVPRDVARVGLRRFGKYFDDNPDMVVKFTSCRGASTGTPPPGGGAGGGAGGTASLAGDYICLQHCPAGGKGRIARIEQSGERLTFINEAGNRSAGQFLSSTTVVASGWGNLRATLSADRMQLRWSNGTVWQRR